MFRAVLFDAAGTLFTTRGSVGEIYASVARQYSSSASPEMIQAAFLRHFQGAGPLSVENQKTWWKDVVHRVFSDVGMISNFDDFFEDVYSTFRDSQGWILFPETVAVLSEVRRRGMKLGIVSNFDDRIYPVLRSLGIRDYFDTVILSSETGFCKPQLEIFQAAIRALGVPAAEILMVGDNLRDDVEAGSRAGLHTLLVDRSSRRGISSLDQIFDFMSKTP
jgi:putative hydrolase of the HAD superfamily